MIEHILKLWQPEAFSLIALVIGAPLFGAFFNGAFGKRVGKNGVRIMALTAMTVSFLAAIVTFLVLRHEHAEAAERAEAAIKIWRESHPGATEAPFALEPSAVKLSWLAWNWFSIAQAGGDGRMAIDLRFSVDELSGVMMLVITGIGLLIHIYSSAYMAKDPGYYRFFAYLNLFCFAMLVLVLGDNMPVMFVGWEGVGLCSYLLIGFWFDDKQKASAGRKAFIANRVGDVGIIGGMLMIAFYAGALDWTGIQHGVDGLSTQIVLFQRTSGPPIQASAATIACLSILLGCTGKSAQLPLYVWLPDAMAGPTPVSALIHAATMVTSGLYLICRLSGVFALSPFAMMIVAIVGAVTALFAATMGLVQNDIKKVLAYSTVSQLGFMFLGVGVGAYTLGFFHVFTHAFFKACLFLGAGCVIHAMHARIHDENGSQDMRNMGGLRKYMPWTFASMGISTLAIAGVPPLSGFFSKDGILFHAYANRVVHPYVLTAERALNEMRLAGKTNTPQFEALSKKAASFWAAPTWVGPMLYAIGFLAACLTAFYMGRLLFKTFFGDFRGWVIDGNAALATSPIENHEPLEDEVPSHEAHGAHDAHGHDAHGDAHEDEAHGHDGHHHEDLQTPGAAPAESPWQMAFPVALLALGAAVVGFLLAEPLHIEPLGKWLEPVFHVETGRGVLATLAPLREGAAKMEIPLLALGVLPFIAGLGLAYFWYVVSAGKPAEELAAKMPGLHRVLFNKWYVDEAYEATIIGGTDALADAAVVVDQWVVDGILAKLTAALVSGFGALLRFFQTGVVHVYGAFVAVGTLVLFVFFARPHADVTLKKTGDQFTVEAAPGLGYEYKWSVEGGTADAAFASGEAAVRRTVTVPQDTKKTLVLEVRNAFGRTVTRNVEVDNPKPSNVVPVGFERQAAPGAGGTN
jgi:NADH-quinone oxidoreductase subunit L